LIDNDCNLAAQAELWLNEKEAPGLDDFVLLEIGDVEVGAGIILNRRLYRGHGSSFAAEFGDVVVDPEGPRCRCGRRECLELYVCDGAIWRSYSPKSQFSAPGFATLCQLARRRDARALAAFEKTAADAPLRCGAGRELRDRHEDHSDSVSRSTSSRYDGVQPRVVLRITRHHRPKPGHISAY